jgi:AraC family transcriptional regulator of adaptative response / DNA-3-methyladenine glycosylase II
LTASRDGLRVLGRFDAEVAFQLIQLHQRTVPHHAAVPIDVDADRLDLHVGRDPGELREELLALPGIGPWTADYVAMRVLGATDVLLTDDLALRNGAQALGLPATPAALTARLAPLRPWRSYAGMHLWRAQPTNGRQP